MPRQSYWILLTAPHVTETYIPPEGDKWTYEISPKFMVKKGDIVYLWLNYQMGFYGWGEVAETPKIIVEPETKDSQGRKRQVVAVNRKKAFEPPITQQIMMRHRNLKNLIPSGYDDFYAIEIRPGQANYINDFVRQHGLEPPVGSEVVDITIEDVKPQFLVKTLLTFKEKTDEGKLVQAVNIPWFDIIDLLIKDPNAAYEIPAEKWEEIIAGAYHQAGFEEVTLTPRSGDYGRDVIAVKKGLGTVRIIDQVKAYKPSLLVSANDVRALGFVLQADNAAKGFVTTTSDFAPKIKDDPFISPWIPSRLELINGEKLLQRLIELRDD
jgi:restriction system protein